MDRVRVGGFPHRKSAVVVAAALLLAGVDFVILRGEHTERATVYFNGPRPARFQVERVGENHLVEIRSPRRVDGEDIGFRLSYWVETPGGEMIPGGSELRPREKRSLRFVPEETGEHEVHVERDGLVLGSSGGSARVDIYANDRRLLPRLLALVPFP